MTEGTTALRPAHEVILDAIAENVSDGELNSLFHIAPPVCSAQAVQLLCDVMASSHIPEKDLGYVTVRLRGILASSDVGYHSLSNEANILGLVTKLESRMKPKGAETDEPRSAAHLPKESGPSVEDVRKIDERY